MNQFTGLLAIDHSTAAANDPNPCLGCDLYFEFHSGKRSVRRAGPQFPYCFERPHLALPHPICQIRESGDGGRGLLEPVVAQAHLESIELRIFRTQVAIGDMAPPETR